MHAQREELSAVGGAPHLALKKRTGVGLSQAQMVLHASHYATEGLAMPAEWRNCKQLEESVSQH